MPFKALGFLFVGLAALGALLPLLPTTPFLLLAGACFARSSAKWHAWLHNNRIFGPLLIDWEQRRCIPLAARRLALLSMLTVGGYSVGFAVSQDWLRGLGLGLLLIGALVVCRLKVCEA